MVVVVTVMLTAADAPPLPVTVYEHVPAASAEKLNGPTPVDGVTLAMFAQVVVVNAKPPEFAACATETVCAGTPAPAAVNASVLGVNTTAAPVGVGVAPGVGLGFGVGVAPIGEGVLTGVTDVPPPPPPQAVKPMSVAHATGRNLRTTPPKRQFGVKAYAL